MRLRATTSTGDWQFGGGLANYVQNQTAAIQFINSRLLCFLGDCFFDAGNGIPWFQYLGTPGAQTQLALQLAVAATLLNTTDDLGNQLVLGINQLNINVNAQTRKLSIQYEAITLYSTVTSQFVYNLSAIS